MNSLIQKIIYTYYSHNNIALEMPKNLALSSGEGMKGITCTSINDYLAKIQQHQ